MNAICLELCDACGKHISADPPVRIGGDTPMTLCRKCAESFAKNIQPPAIA